MDSDKVLTPKASTGEESRMGRKQTAGIVTLGVLVLALMVAGSASARVTLCPPGQAAGQCEPSPSLNATEIPTGVATDPASGQIYVADTGNRRIDVFSADGTFLEAFGWGVADGVTDQLQTCTTSCSEGVGGPGHLQEPVAIAVDTGASSPGQHDVYVAEGGGDNSASTRPILRFSPDGQLLNLLGSAAPGPCRLSGNNGQNGVNVAVGPSGVVYVADSAIVSSDPFGGHPVFETNVLKFNPDGSCAASIPSGETTRAIGIAVDPTGDFYVNYAVGIHKYAPSGTELYGLQLGQTNPAIALDSAGDLFVATEQAAAAQPLSYRVLTEYGPAGTVLRRFHYSRFGLISALAIDSAGAGEALGSEFDLEGITTWNGVIRIPFPESGPVAVDSSLAATQVSGTVATLGGELNPEGEPATYHFEYVDQDSYEAEGGFASPATRITPVGTISGGEADFNLHRVEARIGCPDPVAEAQSGTCLLPETTYRYRLVATGTGPGEGTSAPSSLTTLPVSVVKATFAKQVGLAGAILGAAVIPGGVPTTGYFEYVDDATYQASGFSDALKAPDVEQGEPELDFGSGNAESDGTVAIDSLDPGTLYHYRVVVTNPLIEPSSGPERTFTTFSSEVAEQCPGNEQFRVSFSAPLADCRAYEMVSPLEKGGDVIALNEGTFPVPAATSEGSTNGDRFAYGSYRPFAGAESAPFTTQYVASRGPAGWVSHPITPRRGHLNTEPAGTLDTEVKAFSPDLCDAWVRTVAEPPLAAGAVPGFINLYRRQDEECGGAAYEALTTARPPHVRPPAGAYPLELEGVSADGSSAIYIANDNLPGTGAPNNPTGAVYQLYEKNPAGLHFVCVLPNGQPFTGSCSAGTGPMRGAPNHMANLDTAFSSDGSRVFWTGTPAGVTELPETGEGKIYLRIDGSHTVAVSAAAEEAESTSTSQFWTAAADGTRAIFSTGGTLQNPGGSLYEFVCESADCLNSSTHLVAEKQLGVLGASGDAENFYFASEEALGGPNGDGVPPVAGQPNLYFDREGAIEFIGALTRADVKPINVNAPLSIVPFNRTSRVTPDGLHAAFMSFAPLTGYDNTDAVSGETDAEVFVYDALADGGKGKLLCASCNPTNGRPQGENLESLGAESQKLWAAGAIPTWENTLYASRVLSEDGSRLFFESSDALVPRDTDGIRDIYEWETPGTGGCSEGDHRYSPVDGGCITLISSGQETRAPLFLDASPSGDDIFFSTLTSLLPQDPALVDVYDSRVGGGLPPPPPPPSECEGEVCQPGSAPVAGQPAPASTIRRGPEKPGAKPKCAKGRVRRQGRCVKPGNAHHHKKKHHNKKHQKKNGAKRGTAR
jgi:sugar lactone lactonase YvrE